MLAVISTSCTALRASCNASSRSVMRPSTSPMRNVPGSTGTRHRQVRGNALQGRGDAASRAPPASGSHLKGRGKAFAFRKGNSILLGGLYLGPIAAAPITSWVILHFGWILGILQLRHPSAC